MAAISLSPLPPSVSDMTSRRAPLSNNTNAINTSFRQVATSTIASKQKRSHANVQREEAYGQPPPAKKQMLESHQILRTPPRNQNFQSASLGVQYRKDHNPQQSSLERKSVKVRDKSQITASRVELGHTDDHDTIKKWQMYYRRIFPSFVFYFENVVSEIQAKYTKAIMNLGAREEKFFSNTVTHVITTRNIPSEVQVSSNKPATTCSNLSSQKCPSQMNHFSSTEKSLESTKTSEQVQKTKANLEALSKRLVTNSNTGDSRRYQGRSTDVLLKARELGMKIWSLEKLERIIRVIFDTEAGYQVNYGTSTRSNSTSVPLSRLGRETDLQQLLRNEKINGPSDRDLTVASRELYVFKGPYIYIHDIDEKLKPIMVREYPKVYNKEDGDWPQFRSVSNGKCPFIDEVDCNKREAEKEMEQMRIRNQLEKEKAFGSGKKVPPSLVQIKPLLGKRVLEELYNDANSTSVPMKQKNLVAQVKKTVPPQQGDKSIPRGNAFVSRAGVGHLYDGEPVASGLQPTITSAIRSTMSSTAAQPGVKAGTSKEVHGMQRKVLEKKITGLGSHDLLNPQPVIDNPTPSREEVLDRKSRVKISNKTSLVDENKEVLNIQENSQELENTRVSRSAQQQSTVYAEPKPGFCENCLDKFDDFNEHVQSRKHRKFAEKSENWKLLDELLAQLARPLRGNLDDHNN